MDAVLVAGPGRERDGRRRLRRQLLVLLGLTQLLGGYGLLVGAVTGLCSPTAIGLLARLRRRCNQRQHRAQTPGILLDPAMVDRRFEDMVRRLEQSG